MPSRYSQYLALAKDPLNGLVEQSVLRTITIPWSHAGSASFAVEKILERSTHFLKYDYHLRGIPIVYSIDTDSLKDGLVIMNQPCVHCNVITKFILFRAKLGAVFKGIVTSVISRQATLTLQNVCTVRVNVANLDIREGDTVTVKITDLSLSGGNYAIKGEIEQILKKSATEEEIGAKARWKLPDSIRNMLNTSLDTSIVASSSVPCVSPDSVMKKVKLSDTDTDEDSKHSATLPAKPIEPEPDQSQSSKKKKKRKHEKNDTSEVFIGETTMNTTTDNCDILEGAEKSKKKKKKKKHRETL